MRSYGLIILVLGGSALAQDVTYQPINPSFGGSSFNSSHLLATAEAQNQHKPEKAKPPTQSERFISMLQSRLYSSLATKVSEAIFGENAQDSGHLELGDQTVDFYKDVEGNTVLTITSPEGETTISIPAVETAAIQ